MKDEYGFDPDDTTLIEDNPFWDCTDFAHPAWHRGSEYGIKMTVAIVNDMLDGKIKSGTFGCVELESLKQRLIDLMWSDDDV